MTRKRVLVTGAGGFVGRSTLPRLRELGYEIHATSRGHGRGAISRDVRWHRVDLLDDQQVTELMDAVRPTHMLHLAWYAEPGRYQSSLENLHWVRASLYLVDQFLRWGGRRIAVSGTCAEYNGGDEDCREDLTPVRPAMLYGTCKHALHTMLESWSRQAGFSLAWGRLFFVYGPFEHRKRLVASVIRSLLKGEPVPCTAGHQERDFLHVSDVAHALVSLLDSDVEGPVNVASGEAVAVRDIVAAIGSLLDREDLIKLGALPTPEWEPARIVADVRRLRDEVGWRPEFSLTEGVADTVDWWRRQPR